MNNVIVRRDTLRFEKVCNYIALHLDDDLSVDKLSLVAHYSKYHFHRQFQCHIGMNVGKYIAMMRLKRASYQLVFNVNIQIIDIALGAGYENAGSFSRAFKKSFAQTPMQFRRTPQWEAWHKVYLNAKRINRESENVNIEIINRAESNVAVLEHQGSPQSLNNSIQTFIEWRKQSTESPVATSQTFGIPYNDPNNVAADEFRFDICGSIDDELQDNQYGVIAKSIPEGRFAKIRHLGSHDKMDAKIYTFYREWLPKSGEELSDFPLFFHYINFFPEVAEHELITDIYFALK
ncbi:MAG: AraC family transcriptional regulator [Aliivibrio sp.]|uniref:AraC family transcriptional regulator n=1 Tax=Aliivibrio sp. TaxID=1872443 RepID=UPI001A37BA35|nr:AraC family transcriptional regulator [Aliivibrio sp.]